MLHKRLWCVGAIAVILCANVMGQTSAPATTRVSRFSRNPEQEITFQQGLLHYSNGQLSQAETEFRQVIQADSTDAEGYYHLGLAQLDQGKAADAVASFDQSIRLDPSALEVKAARATANIRQAKYDAAETDLKDLEGDPAWQSFVHYSRGQVHYGKGDLDEAAKEFGVAKALGGTEAVPAGFYEGLTYIRMRELVRARSTFREASIDADRDPTVAAASRQLDAVLAAQQRRNKPWEVQLTLGYEWDSNVIQLGSNVPNPEGISDQSDFRLLIQPRGSYSFYRKDKLELGIEGSGYFTWQMDLDDFNIESYQAGPFMNYRLTNNLFASIRYGYNLIRVGRDNFLQRHIITPQLTYVEPKFGYTSGYYQFQARTFEDSGSEGTPFDRDGYNNTVGLVQGINLPELFKGAGPANLEVSYRFENQQTDGSDFDGNFNSIGATLYTPLPVAKLRGDIGVNLGYDLYSHGNSLDANGDDRRDFEFNVIAGLTREIVKGCALRVDYSYTNHNSNVENGAGQKPYEYDRHQVGVRLIISY